MELYEDIQDYKGKTTLQEINEMKRSILVNHFSSPQTHQYLGITSDFVALQRQELDKPCGSGFQMTEELIINYLSSKHYYERFLLSDFYKSLQSNRTVLGMLKKHSLSTLIAVYEYVKVSIVLDTTKDPEVFHQHVQFYNLSVAAKSSVYRSSMKSGNSARQDLNKKRVSLMHDSELSSSYKKPESVLEEQKRLYASNRDSLPTEENMSSVVNDKPESSSREVESKESDEVDKKSLDENKQQSNSDNNVNVIKRESASENSNKLESDEKNSNKLSDEKDNPNKIETIPKNTSFTENTPSDITQTECVSTEKTSTEKTTQ